MTTNKVTQEERKRLRKAICINTQGINNLIDQIEDAEAHAAELERQRDRLAEKAVFACNRDCPFDECCPFPSGDCNNITAHDWNEWAAQEEEE